MSVNALLLFEMTEKWLTDDVCCCQESETCTEAQSANSSPASSADVDPQDLARIRRSSVRKKRNFTDEEMLSHIGVSYNLCINQRYR